MIGQPARKFEPIRVLFCANAAFYQHLAVALVSMLENNRDDDFEIHLIQTDHAPQGEAMLMISLSRFTNFSLHIYKYDTAGLAHFFTSYHVSVETYLRIFAADLLSPTIDKILYLDSDIVVTGRLRELWEIDLGTFALAAVPDPFGKFRQAQLGIPEHMPYVNAGVLLMNLRQWRAAGCRNRLVAFIEAAGERLMFYDQDAINAVLYDVILPLDYRWNFQARLFNGLRRWHLPDRTAIKGARRNAAIVHFTTGEKPWMFEAACPRKMLYRRYLRLTEWRNTPSEGRRIQAIPTLVLNCFIESVGLDRAVVLRMDPAMIGRFFQRRYRKIMLRLGLRGASV